MKIQYWGRHWNEMSLDEYYSISAIALGVGVSRQKVWRDDVPFCVAVVNGKEIIQYERAFHWEWLVRRQPKC